MLELISLTVLASINPSWAIALFLMLMAQEALPW